MSEGYGALYRTELRAFLDGEGRLRQMPARHRKRLFVYLYAAEAFAPGRVYTQGEVNASIRGLISFDDPLVIRRALVDYGFLERKADGSAYWKAETQPTPASLGL